MTMMDIAVRAMEGILAGWPSDARICPDSIASVSFEIADAMLRAEREQAQDKIEQLDPNEEDHW